MSSSSNTGCVCSMGTLIVGCQRVDLFPHENRTRQTVCSQVGRMTSIVSRIIHPRDAACIADRVAECIVLIVKSSVNNADDHATAVIGLQKTIIHAIDYPIGMSDAKRAVGTELHELTDLDISDSCHRGNCFQ